MSAVVLGCCTEDESLRLTCYGVRRCAEIYKTSQIIDQCVLKTDVTSSNVLFCPPQHKDTQFTITGEKSNHNISIKKCD